MTNARGGSTHLGRCRQSCASEGALATEWAIKNRRKLKAQVYDVPDEVDDRVSRLKLQSMGIKIDTLTKRQRDYLSSRREGT